MKQKLLGTLLSMVLGTGVMVIKTPALPTSAFAPPFEADYTLCTGAVKKDSDVDDFRDYMELQGCHTFEPVYLGTSMGHDWFAVNGVIVLGLS